jgi:hypothetical protein
VTPDRVEAMLVGRWHNGSPLAQHPDEPGAYTLGANDFRYFAATPSHEFRSGDAERRLVQVPASPADPDGVRCPYLAHIRKVNPRDAPTDLAGEPMALALQPFRRGIPYGDPRDGECGLLFLAYTTAIDERFGALSRGWASLGVAPEPSSLAPDAIAGGARHVEFQVDGARVPVPAPRPFVETVGAGFFFAPSIHTLTELASCR